MRAQLSLELMLYVALAGLSFAFALGVTERSYAGIGASTGSFGLSQFIDVINGALLSSGAFSGNVYLPQGLCEATANNNSISTRYGSFYIVDKVSFAPGTMCPDGEYANIAVSVRGGIAYINRQFS